MYFEILKADNDLPYVVQKSDNHEILNTTEPFESGFAGVKSNIEAVVRGQAHVGEAWYVVNKFNNTGDLTVNAVIELKWIKG